MSTLIEVRDGSGKVVARCDASCYLATKDECRCVCCGKNHGVGLVQALKNMPSMLDDLAAPPPGLQVITRPFMIIPGGEEEEEES